MDRKVKIRFTGFNNWRRGEKILNPQINESRPAKLENDCRTYERVDESLRESLISGNVNELAAVIHDPPRGPEMSISEICPVVGSNPIAIETPYTNIDLPEHRLPRRAMLTGIRDGWKKKKMLDVLNDNQEHNEIFVDADYSSDRLATNEIFKRSDENVSQESNLINRLSTVADLYSSNQF
ncbi:unnamed protein product [Schistosoma mattheei]|uniref:Uncharacterized protein n=1 Tax=Schistosoma mattheei TaxID=31246 RepID=A0A183Q397_9TREM|nr:unnamed protein product [Schistosoma mattheei]